MADFTIIETQEQLDSIIRDRVDRAKRTATEEANAKYADYNDIKSAKESLEAQVADLNSKLSEAGTKAESASTELEDLKAKVAKYETDSVKTKIAAEMGLGLDALQFIQGDDEEAIRKSAESLKSLVGKQTTPLANLENNQEEDGVTKAFRKLNPKLDI